MPNGNRWPAPRRMKRKGSSRDVDGRNDDAIGSEDGDCPSMQAGAKPRKMRGTNTTENGGATEWMTPKRGPVYAAPKAVGWNDGLGPRLQRKETMKKPRLLDLFCCAGGLDGLRRVLRWLADIIPQPHYPFEFHQAMR